MADICVCVLYRPFEFSFQKCNFFRHLELSSHLLNNVQFNHHIFIIRTLHNTSKNTIAWVQYNFYPRGAFSATIQTVDDDSLTQNLNLFAFSAGPPHARNRYLEHSSSNKLLIYFPVCLYVLYVQLIHTCLLYSL